MKNLPPCATCKFWSPDGQHTTSGWCHHHQLLADSSDWCAEHKAVIITKSTTKVMTSTPITETVQAALWYAKPEALGMGHWDYACNKMRDEVIEQDRHRGWPQLAAAARILADEVVRLRAIPQNAVLSGCCEAPAVVAGKPESTQWYVCQHCCQPCDIFYQDKNTQPE